MYVPAHTVHVGAVKDLAHWTEQLQIMACMMQTLRDAQGVGGVALMDSFDEILAFAKQVLNKTHLAWSVHVGGGNSYKCSLFAQSNAAQMQTTEVDMLKAALLSSKHLLISPCFWVFCL